MSDSNSIPETTQSSLEQAEVIMKLANDAVVRSGAVIDDLGIAASPSGLVEISGYAQTFDAATLAEKAVSAVGGVTRVINTIIVLEKEA